MSAADGAADGTADKESGTSRDSKSQPLQTQVSSSPVYLIPLLLLRDTDNDTAACSLSSRLLCSVSQPVV